MRDGRTVTSYRRISFELFIWDCATREVTVGATFSAGVRERVRPI